MPPTPGLSTAKAYVASLSTGIAAALAALAPFVDGPASITITIVLAVLASYGVTYAVPNAQPGARRRGGLGDVVDGLLGRPADSDGGAPTA